MIGSYAQGEVAMWINDAVKKAIFTLGQLESEWKYQIHESARAFAHVNPGPPPKTSSFPSTLTFTGGYGFTYNIPSERAMFLLGLGQRMERVGDEMGLITLDSELVHYSTGYPHEHIKQFKKAQRESNRHCIHAELSTTFWRKMRGEIYDIEGIAASNKLGIDVGDVGALFGAIVHVFPDGRNTPDVRFAK
ncbi:hypothetical protein [Maridesulfovibrio sp.]|uniref:hypothetical protein n=1 Tax=Maridesulfovibrio sp. TaxID=2795000 RepID=UPI0029CA6674|nr:hypothetical protein [Maridesulfovibrio sp.]